MRRIRELDAVRGLAALAIVVYHFKTGWLPFGWGAVDLFFVLSGYLITTIILANGRTPGFLVNFYARRGLRIWPIYYLTILTIVALGPILPRPNDPGGLVPSLTYTQNVPHYWGGPVRDLSWYLKHTWTLAIEEQFYLIWPPVVLLVGRRGLPALAALVATASVTARAAGFHWWILLSRCDGFALGGLLAWWFLDAERADRNRTALVRSLSTAGGLALAYLTLIHLAEGLPDHGAPRRPASTILAMNVLFAAAVGLVVAHAGRPSMRPLRGPVLGYLGAISYGLYIYHMILLRIKMDYARQHGLGRTPGLDLLVLAASVLLAVGSWHLVERPILGLKRRFEYRRARPEGDGRRRLDPPQEARPARRPAARRPAPR